MDESRGNLGIETVPEIESEYQPGKKEVKLQKPLHTFRDSFQISSTDYNAYKGLVYLFPILLILINISIGLEYIAKYGVLIRLLELPEFLLQAFKTLQLLLISSLNLSCLISFGLEILLSKGVLNENFGLLFIILSLTLELMTPCIAVYFMDSRCVAASVFFIYAIVFLKLVSYHVENYSFRKRIITVDKSDVNNVSRNKMKENGIKADKDSDMVQYPDNLNIKNFYYFLFSPTLCYELNFPRTPNIRKKFALMRLLELLFITLVLVCVLQQTLIPFSTEYQEFSQDMEYRDYALISIKFFNIMVFATLAANYGVFYSLLNTLSELIGFGDRYFFEDWWNSGNMKEFWRSWNIPVHRWSVRYVYKPALNRGLSKFQATSTVFLISAIFHEYLFSLPVKILKFKMGLLMIVQIPLVFYSSKQPTNRTGSIFIWLFTYFAGIILTACLAQNP